ncbi:MAG TPA: hypothetical protein VIW29_16355 [Polyangiaceae bacterium]
MRRFSGIGGVAVLTLAVICMGAAPAAAAASSAKAAAPGNPAAGPARDNYDGPPLLLGKPGRGKVGGYGSIGAGYTTFMGKQSGLMSMEGAVLIHHRLSLGFAGYGFSRTPCGCRTADGALQEIGAGYGGFVGRYSLLTHLPVYLSVGVLLGGGATNLHPRDTEESHEDDWNNDEWDEGEVDSFVVVQPEATLHLNVTRWFRVGASAGYRFTGGVSRFLLDESDLNGPVVGGSLQFGWF